MQTSGEDSKRYQLQILEILSKTNKRSDLKVPVCGCRQGTPLFCQNNLIRNRIFTFEIEIKTYVLRPVKFGSYKWQFPWSQRRVDDQQGNRIVRKLQRKTPGNFCTKVKAKRWQEVCNRFKSHISTALNLTFHFGMKISSLPYFSSMRKMLGNEDAQLSAQKSTRSRKWWQTSCWALWRAGKTAAVESGRSWSDKRKQILNTIWYAFLEGIYVAPKTACGRFLLRTALMAFCWTFVCF